jgi:hypothetical protein
MGPENAQGWWQKMRRSVYERQREDTVIKHFGPRRDLLIFKQETGQGVIARKNGSKGFLKAGLVEEGGSDLVICQALTITQEMVGSIIGRWVVAEMKADWSIPLTPGQETFIGNIIRMGGSGGKVVVPEDLERLLIWKKG